MWTVDQVEYELLCIWICRFLIVLAVLDLFERIVDVEDRASCYDAISSACSREFVPCDAEKLHPVEHPQAHFVISKLLKSDSKLDVKLSDFIMKHCGEQIASWVSSLHFICRIINNNMNI